jgi:hypothetical protein
MHISDETVQKAFDTMIRHSSGCNDASVCNHFECECRDAMRAAIEAVAPMIFAQAVPPLPWTDAQMRQMGGEMTAQEIRAVRAFAPMIRKAALEEAAEVAEARGWAGNKSSRNVDGYSEGGFDAADEIADAIRKLGEA